MSTSKFPNVPIMETPDHTRRFGQAINHLINSSADLSLDNAFERIQTFKAGVSVTGDIALSGSVKIANVQVVGAQQAAIANDASGAANQATVNAILAALRAHGLIAT